MELLSQCASENAPELRDVLKSLGFDVSEPPATTEDTDAAVDAILAGFGI